MVPTVDTKGFPMPTGFGAIDQKVSRILPRQCTEESPDDVQGLIAIQALGTEFKND
jgi:hypothetical protein